MMGDHHARGAPTATADTRSRRIIAAPSVTAPIEKRNLARCPAQEQAGSARDHPFDRAPAIRGPQSRPAFDRIRDRRLASRARGGVMSELVMLIEDEKEIRDLVRYNLERAGYRVSALVDGEEGLERVFASRPDLLILDLMMPGLNGLEVLRELRGEPATRDLPVLVLTARAAEMDKLLGFEHGADDYLTKPFSPRELTARVHALLRRARPDRQGVPLTA